MKKKPVPAKYKKIIVQKKQFLLILALLALIFFVLLTAGNILAQDKLPMVVAPARQTVVVDPGKSTTQQIRFFNQSSVPLSGVIKVVDFIVSDADGSPILLEDQDVSSYNQYTGASWIKLPFTSATIAAGDVLRVNYTVTVPDTTQPGGRYVAFIFEPTTNTSPTGLSNEEELFVSARVVGLLSIRVSGAVSESAFVDVFKVPVFLQFGPVPVYFEILNKGGYHITPQGQVTLTNLFNKEVDQYILDTKNIFPGAKRSYETSLGKTFMFGKYLVSLTASYGESGKTVNASQVVWVIPIALIIAIILGITIIALIVALIYRKVKEKQVKLEKKLEKEITELEELKDKFRDRLPKS